MYNHLKPVLDRAQAAATEDGMYEILAELPLEEFVHALFMPDPAHPVLQARLPSLPPVEIQQHYVGADSARLEQMTSAFVENLRSTIVRRYSPERLVRRDLRILDYGAGWGRIARMMAFFTAPTNIRYVDPVQQSLDWCQALRVPGQGALCEPIPQAIAFDDETFDIVYSFSVFTHVSERVARAILKAARARIQPDGCFVLTIRPVEFWPLVEPAFGPEAIAQAQQAHMDGRYAFLATDHLAVGDEPTFGDSSWDFDYMALMAKDAGWKLEPGWRRSLVDPYQIVVTLTPA